MEIKTTKVEETTLVDVTQAIYLAADIRQLILADLLSKGWQAEMVYFDTDWAFVDSSDAKQTRPFLSSATANVTKRLVAPQYEN